jgi:hypothetical protein
MWFSPKPARPFPDFQAQLQAVPIRNAAVRIRPAPVEDAAIAEAPLKRSGLSAWFARRMGWSDSHRRYEIDAAGLELWNAIDGARTIESLLDEFRERHKLTFFEARGLVLQYLHLLMARGLIVVAVKK